MMSTYLSKILFFTKKIIVLFTVFATLSANMSFALTPVSLSNQDYFKITTSAGKDMEIDLSTVQINKDVVTFSTKHKIDNYYINRISINVQDRTFKKLKQDIYETENEIKNPANNVNQLKPKLIYMYFWLVDHYIQKNQTGSEVSDLLLKIKILDRNVYDLYIK